MNCWKDLNKEQRWTKYSKTSPLGYIRHFFLRPTDGRENVVPAVGSIPPIRRPIGSMEVAGGSCTIFSGCAQGGLDPTYKHFITEKKNNQ